MNGGGMKRKIVQLVAPKSGGETLNVGLVALCDDGTVWGAYAGLMGVTWAPLPPIPQPEEFADDAR